MYDPGVVDNAQREGLGKDCEPGPAGMDIDLYRAMMAVSAGRAIEPRCMALVPQWSGSRLADEWAVAALASSEKHIRGSLTVAIRSHCGLSAGTAGDADTLEEVESLPVELPLMGPHPRYRH